MVPSRAFSACLMARTWIFSGITSRKDCCHGKWPGWAESITCWAGVWSSSARRSNANCVYSSLCAQEPERSFLPALVLPGVVIVARDLIGIVARKRRGADEHCPQQAVEAVVAVGRVVDQRDGMIARAERALDRDPVLARLLFAVGAALEHGARDFGEDRCMFERGGNLEHEHLLSLTPVDDELKLDHVPSRDLADVEHDLGILPAGALPRDARERAIFNHARRLKRGPADLLRGNWQHHVPRCRWYR